MIKVLHLIKSLGRGGAEVLLSETLKLHQQGYYEFHYIYFLPWKNQMVANLEDSGGKVVCIPANNNASIILQYKKVAQYIIQNKINKEICLLGIGNPKNRAAISRR